MKKSFEEQLKDNCKRLAAEIANWKYINQNGCNDPFWPDGSNMNLVRNHIIYYKHQIEQICKENGLQLPEEYYIPTPPEVDNGYMANLKQKERVKRIRQRGDVLTSRSNKYDEEQLSLF